MEVPEVWAVGTDAKLCPVSEKGGPSSEDFARNLGCHEKHVLREPCLGGPVSV